MTLIAQIPDIVYNASLAYAQATDMNLTHTLDSTFEQKMAGVLTENMFRKAFGLKRKDSTKADLGYDLEITGIKYDIKAKRVSSTNFKPTYRCDVHARQFHDLNPDRYLFAYIHQRTFMVHGWITKDNFAKNSTFHAKDSHNDLIHGSPKVIADMYDIAINQLVPINDWKDLEDEPANVQWVRDYENHEHLFPV